MQQKAHGPIVSIEYAFLLFATAIVHLLCLGEAHPLSRLMAINFKLSAVSYVHGALAILCAFTRIPSDWRRLLAWLLYLGNVFVGIILSSSFYLAPSAPSAIEVAANPVYIVQAVVSFAFFNTFFYPKIRSSERVRG